MNRFGKSILFIPIIFPIRLQVGVCVHICEYEKSGELTSVRPSERVANESMSKWVGFHVQENGQQTEPDTQIAKTKNMYKFHI